MSWPTRERGVELGDGWERSGLGLYVPPRTRQRYHRPVCIDLFSGAGGFSLGMHQAGFQVAAALEIWPIAAITYTVNLGRPPERGGVQFHFDTPSARRRSARPSGSTWA